MATFIELEIGQGDPVTTWVNLDHVIHGHEADDESGDFLLSMDDGRTLTVKEESVEGLTKHMRLLRNRDRMPSVKVTQ